MCGYAVTQQSIKYANIQTMPQYLHYYPVTGTGEVTLMQFSEIPPDRVRYLVYGLTQGVSAGAGSPRTRVKRNGVTQATHTGAFSTGQRQVIGSTGSNEDWIITFEATLAATTVYLNPLTAYIIEA